jgi:hypothetical protein
MSVSHCVRLCVCVCMCPCVCVRVCVQTQPIALTHEAAAVLKAQQWTEVCVCVCACMCACGCVNVILYVCVNMIVWMCVCPIQPPPTHRCVLRSRQASATG